VAADAIVILEVFAKTTRATPKGMLDVSCSSGGVHPPDQRQEVAMKTSIKRRLTRAGWRVGTAEEFLGLSDAESVLVELRLALSRSLRERRVHQGVSQVALAARLGSSQSRVAKMEAADPTVSLDLLVRTLLALGARRRDIARMIDEPGRGRN
jgi:ribosome-binding protein aMBF1 (putative translation factor)